MLRLFVLVCCSFHLSIMSQSVSTAPNYKQKYYSAYHDLGTCFSWAKENYLRFTSDYSVWKGNTEPDHALTHQTDGAVDYMESASV